MAEHNATGKDTGHEWDGIKELTNPPPKWWMISFYISAAWVVVYLVLYPTIPLINGSTEGLLGWTSVKEYKESVAKYDAMRQPYIEKLEKMSAQEILADPEMLNFANSYTKALFGDNCAACHGANGQGRTGMFPVLNDDDWLYGGTVATVAETITGGRQGMMPGHEGVLDDAKIGTLADFVLAISKGQATTEGWAVFNEAGCSGCHGPDAKGMSAMGSANLTDGIWRFGGARDDVLRTIKYGVNAGDKARNAVMPAFGQKLTENQIKLLTVKVWSLGGGQKE